MFDGAVCLPVCTLLQFLQQGENSMRCHLSTAVAWSKQMAWIHANLFNSPYFVCDTTSEIEIIEMVCMCSDYRLRDLKQKRVPQFRVTSQEESASSIAQKLTWSGAEESSYHRLADALSVLYPVWKASC